MEIVKSYPVHIHAYINAYTDKKKIVNGDSVQRLVTIKVVMKNILFFAALVALFSMAFPAMMLVKYEEGKPGHCFSNLTGAMSNGETKDIPGKCMKGDCGEDRTLHISTCISIGKVAATAYNYDEPYPNCCPFPTKGN